MKYLLKKDNLKARKIVLIAILSIFFMPNIINAEGFADNGTIKFKHYDGDALNNLWVFGDSMSDQSMNKLYNKNADSTAKARIAKETWNGRNANGKIWVDWLGEITHIRTSERKNFAVSGAKTDDDVYSDDQETRHNPWGEKWNKMGVASQIRLAKENGLHFGKNDLIAMWAAGNDYQTFIHADVPTKDFGLGSGKLSDSDIDTETSRITNQIGNNMNMLKSMNAKNILVPSWVIMTEIPSINLLLEKTNEYLLNAGEATINVEKWKEKSNKFWNDYNTKLQKKLTKFSNDNPDISIYYVNLIKNYDYLLKNSEHWGIPKENIGKVCNQELDRAGKLKTGDNLNQNDGSKYISWDGIHPTSEVQKLIASAYNSVLQVPRLNAMVVQNTNNQIQSLLDLIKLSNLSITTKINGGIGRSKIDATDAVMQSTSDKYSISAQHRIYKNMGVSIGYINNTTSTNEYQTHNIEQSTTLLTFYNVNKIGNTSHIATQGYFGYTDTPEIKRMVLLNKIEMSGKTTAHSYGGNITYNKNIKKNGDIYIGLNFKKSKINRYNETNGLETGLGIKVGDINTIRTHSNMGFRIQSSTISKYQYNFNLGFEFDISNKIDKYTFTLIDGNVPTHIKEQKMNQSALKFEIGFQPTNKTMLFLNSRFYKNGNDIKFGLSYII